jgi:hypothetical protein
MTTDNLGRLQTKRYTGSEKLHRHGTETDFTLLNFWQWSGSDLISNTARGLFAEYIVASDIGIVNGVNQSWLEYDLKSPEGIRIEVKTSAYIQDWYQQRYSAPRFSIRQAYAWDPDIDSFSDTIGRHSDVYVFCLHHHKDQATIDALDMSQWTFYVLQTARIDQRLGNQKTIGLGRIKSAGAVEADYGEIYSTIKSELRQ